MIAETLSLMTSVLSLVVTYMVHSTLFIGGVWLIICFRPELSHLVRELLWKSALVAGVLSSGAQALLLPAGSLGELAFVLPLNTAMGRSAPHATSPENSETVTRSPLLDDRSEWEWVADVPVLFRADLAELSPDVMTPEGSSSSRRSESRTSPADRSLSIAHDPGKAARAVFMILVLVGSAILIGILRCTRQFFSLRRELAGASEMTDGVARRLLDELIRYVPRGRPVTLLAGPGCSEPIALGLFRWTIVLPVRAEFELTEDELRSLLAHELAHLVRGDAWWLLAGRFVCTLGGFQPLNHLARREWQRAAEFLCDAWAVSRTGNRLALARCLTEVAGWRWQPAECAATLAATGRRNGLADRIETLIQSEPTVDLRTDRRMRLHLTWIMALSLAGIVWTGPRIRLHAAQSEPLEQNRASTRAATNAGTQTAKASTTLTGASDTHRLIRELDTELNGLEADLASLTPLLDRPDAPPSARQLAARLGKSLLQLRKRRAILSRVGPMPAAASEVSDEN